MGRPKSIRVVVSANHRITAVISPGVQVLTVDLPASFSKLTDEEFSRQVSDIPKNWSVGVDSAGATLFPQRPKTVGKG